MALDLARLSMIGFLLAAGAAFAQPASDPAARPAFEVASVKRSTDPVEGLFRVEHGQLRTGIGLRYIISRAYGVPFHQVVAPEWAFSANTVIDAKAGTPVSEDQVMLMLQTLLEDRFKLKVHRETRVTAVAALTVAGRNAPQLKESESARRRLIFDSAKLQEIFTGFTMKEFVEYLAPAYNGTIDRTALPGRYDFVLNYRNLVGPTDDEVTPNVRRNLRPEALQEIGLKLAVVKAPLEFVVVDQLEKYPTEN
jgi:uncharacterized protein (TIGR03435 family)